MYANPGMPFQAGPPAGKPPVGQAQEKGKSKWLSKFLKSSKQAQKPSAQQQQQMWQGPNGLVLPPSQSPAPGAPWSPGSVGTTLAFPPPGAAPMQQVPSAGDNAGQMHQRNDSGGVQMLAVEQQRQPAHAHTKSVPPPVTQPVPGHPLQLNPVISSAPASPPQPSTTSQPGQNTVPAGPPPGTEPAQSPTGTIPARSESVRSNFTSVSTAGARPTRSESVRSDFTTISTSEAEVQHVLRPQLIQVSRPSAQRPSQSNGLASAPQIQYPPPQGSHSLTNGQAVQKHDSLRVAPLHLQKRISAEGVDGASGRESMVSDVSSLDSADSRRVSVLSGSVAQGKRVARVGDYSGGGWGDDS